MYFFQPNGTWTWSDGRPVKTTLWGPHFSPPLPTGRSCYTDNSSSQSNYPSTCWFVYFTELSQHLRSSWWPSLFYFTRFFHQKSKAIWKSIAEKLVNLLTGANPPSIKNVLICRTLAIITLDKPPIRVIENYVKCRWIKKRETSQYGIRHIRKEVSRSSLHFKVR